MGNNEIVTLKTYMLSDGIKAFLQYKKSRIADRTIAAYKSAIKNLITFNYPCNSPNVSAMIIDNYNKTYARNPHTATHYFNTINHMFEYLTSINYIASNPLNKQFRDKPTYQQGYMLSHEEFDNIISIIDSKLPKDFSPSGNIGNKHYLMFIFKYLLLFLSKYGLRINEALNLYWHDAKNIPLIAYDNQKRQSIISETAIIVDGKRSNFRIPKIREIPIDFVPGGRNIIDTLRTHRINDIVFTGAHLQVFSYRIDKVMLEANITEKARFHIFRRYAINYWEKEMNIPPYLCAYLAGHTLAVRQTNYNESPNAASLLNMIKKVSKK